MKRPARPPADVIRGTLFAAAPFVELEEAAVPAAVLVPAELPDDLEAAVPVAVLALDAPEPVAVPVAEAGFEATVPVDPDTAPAVWEVGKYDEIQDWTQAANFSESAVEPSPCGHCAAHSLVWLTWAEFGWAVPTQAAWQFTSPEGHAARQVA